MEMLTRKYNQTKIISNVKESDVEDVIKIEIENYTKNKKPYSYEYYFEYNPIKEELVMKTVSEEN